MTGRDAGFDAVVAAGRAARQSTSTKRSRQALGVSFGVLAVWLIYVTAAGHWGRVSDQWASALTMVFGSFVAGSTPQGGGAVAFPVFTKVLDIPAEVARSFSLCIQAIGMTAASAAIIINRRAVEWRAVAVAAPVAIVSFVLSAVLLGRGDEVFWPSRLPGAYVKVTFTLIVAAMAVVVWLGYRSHIIERMTEFPLTGPRVWIGLVIAAVLGGLASSLTGSGADVLIYVMVVVIVGVSPRVGVPTSVVVMASVSVAAFVLYGLIDGQLDIGLDPTGEYVTSVGGERVTTSRNPGLDPGRFDLFGLWLAAAPVVAFGAPLGSWASSKATDRQLVRFVVLLAAIETLSTIIFLEGFIDDPDPALISFSVVGAIIVIVGLAALKRYRRPILGLPPLDTDTAFTRERLDTGPEFRDQLLGEESPDDPPEVP